jgi:hypothetical protein
MDTTGKALVDHWGWAAEKGVMNKNTAGGTRAAVVQVLSVLENWETVDVKTLDVEDTLVRFQNLKKKDFKPAVLETYKRRFRQAVNSYLAYLEDPGGWKPRTLDRPVADRDDVDGARAPAGASRVNRHEAPQTGIVEYPFPLRDGQMIRLYLPRDLRVAEVKRLTAFMSTLTVDAEGLAIDVHN